jgi:hypothetical protein
MMKEKKANQSINQKHTISNEYDELFADMQALAFVVSSRRMLLIFWSMQPLDAELGHRGRYYFASLGCRLGQ